MDPIAEVLAGRCVDQNGRWERDLAGTLLFCFEHVGGALGSMQFGLGRGLRRGVRSAVSLVFRISIGFSSWSIQL